MLGCALSSLSHAQTTHSSATPRDSFQFSIPAQEADDALTELAKQANTTLLFPFDIAQQITTKSLVGEYTLSEALMKLLEGTELAIVTDESGTVSIRSKSSLNAKVQQSVATEQKTRILTPLPPSAPDDPPPCACRRGAFPLPAALAASWR